MRPPPFVYFKGTCPLCAVKVSSPSSFSRHMKVQHRLNAAQLWALDHPDTVLKKVVKLTTAQEAEAVQLWQQLARQYSQVYSNLVGCHYDVFVLADPSLLPATPSRLSRKALCSAIEKAIFCVGKCFELCWYDHLRIGEALRLSRCGQEVDSTAVQVRCLELLKEGTGIVHLRVAEDLHSGHAEAVEDWLIRRIGLEGFSNELFSCDQLPFPEQDKEKVVNHILWQSASRLRKGEYKVFQAGDIGPGELVLQTGRSSLDTSPHQDELVEEH